MKSYDYPIPFQYKFSEFMGPSSKFSVLKKQVDESFILHCHEFWEVEYIISGTGIQRLNGVEYKLEKGNIYFVNPSDFHEITVDMADPIEMYNIKFSEIILRDEIYRVLYNQNKNHVAYLKAHDLIYMENDLRNLFDEYNHSKVFKDIIISDIFERILITIIRKEVSGKISKTIEMEYEPHPVYKSLSYIQNNFHDNLTLEEVAKEMHISQNYFSELFHKMIGCSFQSYLQNLRLRNALILLTNSGLSPSDVCRKSGFNSYEHFSRIFKRKYGYSPSLLRKNNKMTKKK